MQFFTRELYEGNQAEPETAEADDSDERWRRMCEEYRVHLDRIRAKLPPRMQALADTTLHDGVVRGVARPSSSQLVIELDATRNPWGPAGVFQIHFTGVRLVEGIDQLV